MIDGIYLPRALAGHFDQNSEELRRKIKADGILPLLEDDLGLLADAAAVSLCTPLDHKLESISLFHHWTREDPYEAVATIDSILQKYFGRPVFPMKGRRILASNI